MMLRVVYRVRPWVEVEVAWCECHSILSTLPVRKRIEIAVTTRLRSSSLSSYSNTFLNFPVLARVRAGSDMPTVGGTRGVRLGLLRGIKRGLASGSSYVTCFSGRDAAFGESSAFGGEGAEMEPLVDRRLREAICEEEGEERTHSDRSGYIVFSG